jgi:hypothetical protein
LRDTKAAVRTEGGTAKNMTNCAGEICGKMGTFGIAAFVNALG